MTLAEVQLKWSVILIDRLGPDIFSTLGMKGHVLHRARARLNVPGWLLVWNTLLTKKIPMFLSRLNEIIGGCEKILLVSGSFWSNLKFSKWSVDFTARLWRWNVRVSGESMLWATSFPGSSLYLEKVPWLRLVTCLLDFSRFQRCDWREGLES